MWHIHHKAEILPCGNFSVDDLIKHHLYYQRPAIELVFLTPAQHNKIHNSQGGRGRKMGIKNKGKQHWLGKRHTEESKKKMSNSHRGVIPWNKGKHLLATTRAKMSKATSIAMKGMRWWNDGKVNIRALSCPAGFVAGRLKCN